MDALTNRWTHPLGCSSPDFHDWDDFGLHLLCSSSTHGTISKHLDLPHRPMILCSSICSSLDLPMTLSSFARSFLPSFVRSSVCFMERSFPIASFTGYFLACFRCHTLHMWCLSIRLPTKFCIRRHWSSGPIGFTTDAVG